MKTKSKKMANEEIVNKWYENAANEKYSMNEIEEMGWELGQVGRIMVERKFWSNEPAIPFYYEKFYTNKEETEYVVIESSEDGQDCTL